MIGPRLRARHWAALALLSCSMVSPVASQAPALPLVLDWTGPPGNLQGFYPTNGSQAREGFLPVMRVSLRTQDGRPVPNARIRVSCQVSDPYVRCVNSARAGAAVWTDRVVTTDATGQADVVSEICEFYGPRSPTKYAAYITYFGNGFYDWPWSRDHKRDPSDPHRTVHVTIMMVVENYQPYTAAAAGYNYTFHFYNRDYPPPAQTVPYPCDYSVWR